MRKLLGWERYDTHEAVEAMNDLYGNELRLWLNLFLPSVKLRKKVRVGSKVRRVYQEPRTPFERVRACPEADREQVARLEQLRKGLDPFQLARTIERQLERIYRMGNRRLSPRPVRENVSSRRTRRGKGCGKAVPENRDLEIKKRFSLSHSPGGDGAPVTSQMSRQSPASVTFLNGSTGRSGISTAGLSGFCGLVRK